MATVTQTPKRASSTLPATLAKAKCWGLVKDGLHYWLDDAGKPVECAGDSTPHWKPARVVQKALAGLPDYSLAWFTSPEAEVAWVTAPVDSLPAEVLRGSGTYYEIRGALLVAAIEGERGLPSVLGKANLALAHTARGMAVQLTGLGTGRDVKACPPLLRQRLGLAPRLAGASTDAADDGKPKTVEQSAALRVLSWRDDIKKASPPVELVPRWLAMRYATVLAGDGGTGKSYFMLKLAMAAALAAMRPDEEVRWAGQVVQPGKSVFYNTEDGPGQLQVRIRALFKELGFNWLERTQFDKYVRVVSPNGNAAHLLEKRTVTKRSKRGDTSERFDTFVETDAMRELRFHIVSHDARYVFVDNASRVFTLGANENDRADVDRFLYMLNDMADEYACALVLLAHTNKGGNYSGSTAWNNSPRARWSLDGTKLRVEKSNYGPSLHGVFIERPSGAFPLFGATFDKAPASEFANVDAEDAKALEDAVLAALPKLADPQDAIANDRTPVKALREAVDGECGIGDNKESNARIRAAVTSLVAAGLAEIFQVPNATRVLKAKVRPSAKGLQALANPSSSMG